MLVYENIVAMINGANMPKIMKNNELLSSLEDLHLFNKLISIIIITTKRKENTNAIISFGKFFTGNNVSAIFYSNNRRAVIDRTPAIIAIN